MYVLPQYLHDTSFAFFSIDCEALQYGQETLIAPSFPIFKLVDTTNVVFARATPIVLLEVIGSYFLGDSELVVVTKKLSFETKEDEIVDITGDVGEALGESGLKNGVVTVFVPGATGAITTIECEPGLLVDLPNMLDRVAPKKLMYEHEKRWHDGNGHSHVRASLIGPSISVPFVNGELTLGTWQQIVFLELDVRSRRRSLVLQILGE